MTDTIIFLAFAAALLAFTKWLVMRIKASRHPAQAIRRTAAGLVLIWIVGGVYLWYLISQL